jgi:anti-sigma factor RsiW
MNQYSEQDIQDYVDGTFAGDAKELKTYLETNQNAQKHLQLYKALYSAIAQQPVPSLAIDLAGNVINRIEKRTEVRDAAWAKGAFFVLATLIVIAVLLCYSYYEMHNLFNAAGIIFLIALIAFVIAFHFIEFRVRNKKYLLMMNEPFKQVV